jgi:AAA15 family ATPase/GTPase
MENNHLTYFKIENFKKFDALEVTDIGQFNLIVGDNNVGKTCFLEALLFDEDGQQLLNNFYIGLTKRGFKFQIEEVTTKIRNKPNTEVYYPSENYFKQFIKDSKNLKIKFKLSKENSNFFELEILTSYGVNWEDYKNQLINYEDLKEQFISIRELKSEDDWGIERQDFWIYDYNLDILNFPLITFNSNVYEEETRSIYENLKTKREKQILIDTLKVINPKIVDIELRENFEDLKSVFLISFDDQDEFVPLNFLGDGFKRIFYIILKTISLKGKRIMIDEIEIGIHHSKLKDFWVNIIKVCKELDVQLFASTHSQECIEDFVSAVEVVECQDDARMISLQEYKNKLYASTYNYENIISGIYSKTNLRA